MIKTKAGTGCGAVQAPGSQVPVKQYIVQLIGTCSAGAAFPVFKVTGIHPEIPGKHRRRVTESHQFHEMKGKPAGGGRPCPAGNAVMNGVDSGSIDIVGKCKESGIIGTGREFPDQG